MMQDAMQELGLLLQTKTLALEELTSKVTVLRDTLDCTYTGSVLSCQQQQQQEQQQHHCTLCTQCTVHTHCTVYIVHNAQTLYKF